MSVTQRKVVMPHPEQWMSEHPFWTALIFAAVWAALTLIGLWAL